MSYGENVRIGPSTQASLAPPKECAPASIIEVQMGHLESRVDVIVKLAAVMENRLARVLRQADSPPTKNRDNSPSQDTGVILGNAIAAQTERLQDTINFLNATLERIEL